MKWTTGSKPKSDGLYLIWIIDINRKAKIGRAFWHYAWYVKEVDNWFDREGDYYIYKDKITHFIDPNDIDSPDDI